MTTTTIGGSSGLRIPHSAPHRTALYTPSCHTVGPVLLHTSAVNKLPLLPSHQFAYHRRPALPRALPPTREDAKQGPRPYTVYTFYFLFFIFFIPHNTIFILWIPPPHISITKEKSLASVLLHLRIFSPRVAPPPPPHDITQVITVFVYLYQTSYRSSIFSYNKDLVVG